MDANNRRIGLIALILISWAFFGHALPTASAKSLDRTKLNLALPKTEATGLLRIAVKKGFFESQGLDVTIQEHEIDTESLEAVLDGSADVGAAPQTPIIKQSFERNDFFILATIYTSNDHVKVVARKDKGILTPKDLKSKRIGTSYGTAGHFFLSSFLIHNGMTLDNVRLKHMSPRELVAALEAGKIDAFVLGEPHVSLAKKSLNANGIVLSHKDLYLTTVNLVAQSNYVRNHPDTIKKLMRGLIRAEAFIRAKPKEAAALLGEELQLKSEYLTHALETGRFVLSLDQSLLILMEQEAVWMTKHELVPNEAVPNYLEIIHLQSLEEVRPEAIGVIH